MIFIDFDDVIFNTKQFKHDFKNVFIGYGIPGEIFDKYYNEPNDQNAIKKFNPMNQVERIGKELDIDTEQLILLIEEFFVDVSIYVFDDVKEFVEANKKICIVSFGEKNFQNKKIKNSKILEIINDFIVVEDSKSEAIGKILESKNIGLNEKIFFIDDRIEQISDVKKRFPNSVTIFLKRPEGRYQEMKREKCCDYEAHSLMEMISIMENYEKKN